MLHISIFFRDTINIYYSSFKLIMIVSIACLNGKLISKYYTTKLINNFIDVLAITISLSLLLL